MIAGELSQNLLSFLVNQLVVICSQQKSINLWSLCGHLLPTCSQSTFSQFVATLQLIFVVIFQVIQLDLQSICSVSQILARLQSVNLYVVICGQILVNQFAAICSQFVVSQHVAISCSQSTVNLCGQLVVGQLQSFVNQLCSQFAVKNLFLE